MKTGEIVNFHRMVGDSIQTCVNGLLFMEFKNKMEIKDLYKNDKMVKLEAGRVYKHFYSYEHNGRTRDVKEYFIAVKHPQFGVKLKAIEEYQAEDFME